MSSKGKKAPSTGGFVGRDIMRQIATLQQEMKATNIQARTSPVNPDLVKEQFGRLKQCIEAWNNFADTENQNSSRSGGKRSEFMLMADSSLSLSQRFFLEAYDFFSGKIGDLGLTRDEIKFTT